jgi:imidazolonepropionase-like amidohydrolase
MYRLCLACRFTITLPVAAVLQTETIPGCFRSKPSPCDRSKGRRFAELPDRFFCDNSPKLRIFFDGKVAALETNSQEESNRLTLPRGLPSMTRTTPILLGLSLFLSGLLLAFPQDPAPNQPPVKKTPPASNGAPPKTDKPAPKTDKTPKASPEGAKLPIPPNEMVKRFGDRKGMTRGRPVPPLAIENATIHTMGDAGAFVGTVLLRDGKVAAVGKQVDVPADVRKIDAKGLTLTPGLIDARSAYGLASSENRASAADASLDVLDGVDFNTEDWQELLREGITAVYVQPSGVLGGKGAVLRVRDVRTVEDMTVKASSAVQASINASPNAGNTLSRSGQYEQLKRAFADAKKYDEEWTKYREELRKKAEDAKKAAEKKPDEKDAKKVETKKEEPKKDEKKEEKKDEKKDQKKETPEEAARRLVPNWDRLPDQFKERIIDMLRRQAEAGQPYAIQFRRGPMGQGGPSAASSAGPSAPGKPKVDSAKELLLRVLKREIPLRLEAHREDDVRNAYKLADEFKIRLILEGLNEVRSVQEEIKKRGTPLVLGPFLEWAEAPSAAAESPLEQLRRRLPPGVQLPPGLFAGTPQQGPAGKWDREESWPKGMIGKDSKFAIATFGSEPRESRLLRAHAAAAVANGIDPDAALKAITRYAAEAAGVADRLGTIEAGKDADLVLFAGDPLNPATPTVLVVSGGRVVTQTVPTPAPKTFAKATSSVPSSLPTNVMIVSRNMLNEKGAFAAGRVGVHDGVFNGTKDSAGATVLDVGDLYVTPGLLAGPSSYGLAAGGGDEAAASAGALNAADAFDPEQKVFRKFKQGGFLTAILAPPGNYVAPGVCAAASLGDPLAPTASLAPYFALTRSARNTERFPASLAAQVEVAEKVLGAPQAQLSFIAAEGVSYYVGPSQPAEPTPIYVEAETRAEIAAALDLAAATKRKLVLVEPRDIRPLLQEIKAAGAAIVAAPVRKGDYDYSCLQLVEAARAGIPVLFGGETPALVRLAAARCVGAGMPTETVMRGLTADAAAALGAPKQLGSFAAGGSADFVLWDGPPWDLRRKPVAVVVRGELQPADGAAE